MGRKHLGRGLDRKGSRRIRAPSMTSWEALKISDWAVEILLGKEEGANKEPSESGVRNQRKVILRRREWPSNAIIRTSCGRALKRGYWIWQGGRRLVPSELCDLGGEDQSQAIVRRGRWGNENKNFNSEIRGWVCCMHTNDIYETWSLCHILLQVLEHEEK